MSKKFIARFKGVKGRYLVTFDGYGYGGQKICHQGKRQLEKYGNQPDPETGLWLNEMYRVFNPGELLSIKPAPMITEKKS